MRGDLRALVFDLDDTLIRTYDDLIVPLEREAARLMLQYRAEERQQESGGAARPELPDCETLAETLLHYRRSDPAGLRGAVGRQVPQLGAGAWEAREKLFRNPSVSALRRMPGVRRMLDELRLHYRLFLLTHGFADFQQRKLDKSGLGRYFDGVRMVARSREKGEALAALGPALRLQPAEIGVIGNRLDVEIRMGLALGCFTVWVRSGEGSEMPVGQAGGRPHEVVEDLSVLAGLLGCKG
ncbi:MAG TPA: HAD family hydrolase [Acidobacteriota bacterium]|nr:HAD family hydrolase [Acidobacteriota bacterium]